MGIVERYKKLSLLHKFALNAVLLGALWYLFFFVLRYLSFIDPLYEAAISSLTNTLLKLSQTTLLVFGEDSLIYKKTLQQIGGNGVYIDRGCLGRDLMGLFAGFLVAFPGSIRTKLWYIPMGLVLIFIVNVIRVVGLYLTNKYYPEYMDINHHTVFKYTVYALTFLLWYIWIKKFRKPKVKEVHKQMIPSAD